MSERFIRPFLTAKAQVGFHGSTHGICGSRSASLRWCWHS